MMGTAMSEEQLLFAVFCVESVAEELELGGETVYKKLTQDSKILDEYIIPYYDALHTQGKEYIVEDIIGYMRKEGAI
jgi:hypothetical protein